MIKCCYENILETSVVTLSAGTEDAGFPLYRLYDRGIVRFFKTTAAVTTTVKVDQGGSPIRVDRLLIPAGHNLDGMTLGIEYSDDGISYTPAVAMWVQEGTALIEKSWPAESRRYWRFTISGPSSAPRITELFLTRSYEWEKDPAHLSGPLEPFFNAERDETSSGQGRHLINGSAKRQRLYHVSGAWEVQKNNILGLNAAWAGSKPFFLCDHEGVWMFGELRKPINLKETAYQEYGFDFDFLEVIP
ncbi:MAG: hypothetical protein Q8J64_08745 [Thermodesulfovibrionales bacterium]|nr:hypothetical protein [Thermodesulfovibrionales bacterium]